MKTRLEDLIDHEDLAHGWEAAEIPDEFRKRHQGPHAVGGCTISLLRIMSEMEDRGMACVRREVAARLRRQLKYMRENDSYREDVDILGCGNTAYRNIAWAVEPYGNEEKGNYVHICETLADLIEPQERTCNDMSDDESVFECSRCGCAVSLYTAEADVFENVTYGTTLTMPNGRGGELSFCPHCGARITEVD